MQNPPSPLETLRQLKEMLDAGALTLAEFEVLKQRLVFSAPATAAPFQENEPVVLAPAPPAVLPPVLPPAETVATADAEPRPVLYDHLRAADSVSAPFGTPAPFTPAVVSPVAAVPPAPLRASELEWAADEFVAAEVPTKRNPLALILSIGGLLGLLGLVLYLSFNRPPSEHVSSTSLTAADSVAAPIETGPQAQQLPPAPVAMPETVRVVPSNPAPPVLPRRSRRVNDSAAVLPAAAASDSVARP